MGKRIQLAAHLSTNELEHRYRRAAEATERGWWQILWLLARGYTATAVAESTGYSAYWIGQIAKRYNADGPAGMTNRRHSTSHRQAPIVPPALQEELRQAVAEAQARHEYWTGGEAASWISARLGRSVSYHVGWRYLVRARQSLQVPRPRHTLADAQEQAVFKKS